ncbi:MAG: NAD-dependent protein deacylase [Clostridia bacterium]|nr:NAD-dependent protein deacylase [Clostridia bacterium]
MKSLQEIVNRAKRIVFFGGAGVSTASGIPDFRGEGGLYSREFEGLTPEMILSRSFFYLHPETFFDFYRRHMLHPDAKPNAAHAKLFEMERAGRLTGLVTQNIDGLHRQAGSRLVYELHGSVHENACMECGKPFSMAWMLGTSGIPRCPDCGGVVKPSVVLYGEAPDHYACTGACREIARCDVLIVAGTSLEVEPAASCLTYFRGKELVVINREETPADSRATLVIRGDIAETLGALHIEEAKACVRRESANRCRWMA